MKYKHKKIVLFFTPTTRHQTNNLAPTDGLETLSVSSPIDLTVGSHQLDWLIGGTKQCRLIIPKHPLLYPL